MNSKKKKLKLDETLVLKLEELEKVTGGILPLPLPISDCISCDALCMVTCSWHTYH